jgi:hypothetical protein
VGGAAAYKCTLSGLADAPAENCENDTGITKSTTGTYPVVQTAVKKEGSAAFHLMNSTASSQWIELKPLFSGSAASSVSFQSRVGAATTSERFKVQVKQEGGNTWQTVYEQTGTNGWGESLFSLRTASLAIMAGKQFRMRFLLDYTTGGYFSNTTSEFGWYVDAINFTEVSRMDTIASATVTSSSWAFTPAAGVFKATVTPVISGRDYPGASQDIVANTVTQAPATFLTWAAAIESANGLAVGVISNAHGDHDKDGRCNLFEYAFGGSPVGGRVTSTHFILRYQVDTSLGDLIYTPQACPTMSSWKKPGDPGATSGFTDQLISTEGVIQTREASIPLSSGKCFLRLGVTRQ